MDYDESQLMAACCRAVIDAALDLKVDALDFAKGLDLARIIRLLDNMSAAIECEDGLNEQYIADELAGIMQRLPNSND